MAYRLGVIGSPISHSLTPRIHLAALAHWNLEGTSEAVEIDVSHVGDVAELLNHFDALSVTMPLKELLVPLCQTLDEPATRIGAVNSLQRTKDGVSGRNTDGRGLIDALKCEMDLDVTGLTCVVRGSGGSAKSIIDALDRAGAANVILLARNRDAAEQIGRSHPVLRINPANCEDVSLIVNTIPFVDGINVELNEPEMKWASNSLAVEVVYVPAETPWLFEHRAAGRRTANGLAMLVHQARHQLEWWFERTIETSILLAAVST